MKRAVVTGASSGIGEEIYRFLLQDHYNSVLGVGLSGPDFRVDLTRGQDRQELIEEISQSFQPVDIFVNNAGVLLLDESEINSCLNMVSLNLIAVWDLTSCVYPYMSDGGVIINVASISGMRADPDTPLYGATKAGVISLTKSFAKKFANSDKKVRVNCFSPGFFDTNLVPGPAPQELIDQIPFKRSAKTCELLPLVQMIIDSKYLTGVNIPIDGGLLL